MPSSFASRCARMRAVADLADRTGPARRVGILHGLDRVDRDHVGAHRLGVRAHVGQRRLADDEEIGRERAEPVGPEPHLRRRLLGAHQQAARAVGRHRARAPAARSVLLPMPGSPPTSVTEPATSPPPSTRSSSGTFGGAPGRAERVDVGERAPAARPVPARLGDPLPLGRSTASSEPHSPHSGQRPSHFGDSWPQAVAAVPNKCSCHGRTVARPCDKLGAMATRPGVTGSRVRPRRHAHRLVDGHRGGPRPRSATRRSSSGCGPEPGCGETVWSSIAITGGSGTSPSTFMAPELVEPFLAALDPPLFDDAVPRSRRCAAA